MPDRYVPVLYIREDDRRRWLVIDLHPSATADTGTTVATCSGDSAAIRIAQALNGGDDVAEATVTQEPLRSADMVRTPYETARAIEAYMLDHGEPHTAQVLANAIADVEPF